MTDYASFRKFIGITALVVVLYIFAVVFGLFYTFNWYDTMMHFIGGMAIGYLALAITPATISQGQMIARAAGLAASIGILWEIFERIGNHYLPRFVAYGGTRDTIMDVVYAIIGAVIISLIASRKRSTNL